MNRRDFITSTVCGTATIALPKDLFAGDCGILNGRVARNAAALVGQRVGAKYTPTVFASTVLAKSGAKPMWIGPHGNPRYGREIDFNNLNPGDILQFNGQAAFVRNGRCYFNCNSVCTTIVLNRVHGQRPWSLLDVAYQYKMLGVKRIFLDVADYQGNLAIMFRPQL